jgi:CubicO group peptidase (beta-lactamase class C family)
VIRTAVLICLLAAPCTTVADSPLPPGAAERINAVFAPYDHDGSPGYAVAVLKDRRIAFERGYGRSDLDCNAPITPQTVFHLASLSKQFTAAAVALLILDGRLTLETPVAAYFPQIARFGADMCLKHLVYFTSGLPEYTSQPRENGDPWFTAYRFTVDEAIAATLRAKALKFAPGTQWDYSNVNYMILAKIVERVSGMSLAQFLQTRVFRPLGMSHTLVDDDTTVIIPNRATGYADRGDPEIARQLNAIGFTVHSGTGYMRLVRNSPHYGGSGVFSTVEDLAKWDENFYTYALGGPAFTTQMLARCRFQHPKDNDAFGLVFGNYKGRTMIWFSGGDIDASTYMARLPDLHLTVICLSNILKGDAEGKAMQVLGIVVP